MSEEFKVGDKVEFVGWQAQRKYPSCYPPLGATGTVTKVHGLIDVEWAPGSYSTAAQEYQVSPDMIAKVNDDESV